VTLVEMLVTLAILLLMMTAIVKIFQAATGSLSSAQAYQELDNQLRQLDATIRSDLNGVTARLTPPLNPNNNLGYLEYGENEFADVQGEDSDDYIRFTAKAPAGRPFTGRMYLSPFTTPPGLSIANMSASQQQIYLSTQPITITSEYAEIIYFLRNGNLYRRVLLVAPERQSVIWQNNSFSQTAFGGVNTGAPVMSWQGMNDLSAHPAPRGNPSIGNPIVLNTLGNLTNRENRWAYQRFADDFQNLAGGQPPDGLSDDVNGDNVPDYYPTLYPGVLPAAVGGTGPPLNAAGQLIYEPLAANRPALAQVAAFPFVFPGAYSRPQFLNNFDAGWIHSPEPIVIDANNNPYQYDLAPLLYLQNLNHNPIDVGDNLPLPTTGALIGLDSGKQTWWGLPTWRETLSQFWTDPTWQVNTLNGNLFQQPFGLAYQPANVALGNASQFLPDMTGTYRNTPQPYNDGPFTNGFFPTGTAAYTLWNLSWEDDLIMTGVRSFDIKAYDNSSAAYADLGWGDDPRVTGINAIPYLQGNLDAATGGYNLPAYALVNGSMIDLINQTFAHEGRMPPLQNDNRLDASNPNPNYTNYTVPYPLANYTYVPQYQGYSSYSSNVGDDNAAVVRLRRVWDSWSTDYSRAPATGVFPGGFPAGPPYTPPIYPSYPPPYPAPLRGIQIQIRVSDPTNQRIKTLTIRQDFTDKL
jgi:type II secretory pathway pseudopilin PulG